MRNTRLFYCFPPDVDVNLSAHGAGLDLQPTGVAGDVTVSALHDGGKRDSRTHLQDSQV